MDIKREVVPPMRPNPLAWTKERLRAYREQFANQGRHVKRDITGDDKDETFCNVLVIDLLTGLRIKIFKGLANAIIRWLRSAEGYSEGWRKIDRDAARQMAEAAVIVLATFENPVGPGHIAMVVEAECPDDCEPGKIWIMQAGKINSHYMPLEKGFGSNPVEFFALV